MEMVVKMEILIKNGNFVKNGNFGQKSKYYSKIEILKFQNFIFRISNNVASKNEPYFQLKLLICFTIKKTWPRIQP